jgi:hypothetical protein
MNGADWSRPHWQRGEASAMLMYLVFGGFPAGVDAADRGMPGRLPGHVGMRMLPKATLAHWDGHPLHGSLGDLLRDDDSTAYAAARVAPGCILLHGEVPDAPTLDFLRDTLECIGGLLDEGGVAVVDPQTFSIFSADRWRARFDGAGAASVRNHVLVTSHEAGGGGAWIRTRGLRKFARPDISIPGVPRREAERAGAVAAQLAELAARGMLFGDGSTIGVEGVPGGLTARRAGSFDDPQFNNVHVEIAWPDPARR